MAKPPRHGQVKVSTMKPDRAKRHLSEMTKHLSAMRQYNGHGGGPETGIRLTCDTAQSSQGAMSPGGASGADYVTTNVGNIGDADSGGSSAD